jgi:hypothetical protein
VGFRSKYTSIKIIHLRKSRRDISFQLSGNAVSAVYILRSHRIGIYKAAVEKK